MSEQFESEKAMLYAVNILLETINELPIEAEEDYDVVLEAQQAKDKIIEVKRAVLSEGWDVNTDNNYILPLGVGSKIPVPANVLDVVGEDGNVIMRNWLLYDKVNNTHIFDNEVPCTIIWSLDFNTLTHPIRHYITIRAARIFAARTIGDIQAVKFNEMDEEDARLAARRSEGRTGNYNMLNSKYGARHNARPENLSNLRIR